MLIVIAQDKKTTYPIEYFHIKYDEDYEVYAIIGFARFNLNDLQLVTLGVYEDPKQAYEVCGQMLYISNEFLYLSKQQKTFYMPPNIVDGKEIPISSIYVDRILKGIDKDEFRWLLGDDNYVKDHGIIIMNKVTFNDEHGVILP